MSTHYSNLLDYIDGQKEHMSDGEYLKLMDSLKSIYDGSGTVRNSDTFPMFEYAQTRLRTDTDNHDPRLDINPNNSIGYMITNNDKYRKYCAEYLQYNNMALMPLADGRYALIHRPTRDYNPQLFADRVPLPSPFFSSTGPVINVSIEDFYRAKGLDFNQLRTYYDYNRDGPWVRYKDGSHNHLITYLKAVGEEVDMIMFDRDYGGL